MFKDPAEWIGKLLGHYIIPSQFLNIPQIVQHAYKKYCTRNSRSMQFVKKRGAYIIV